MSLVTSSRIRLAAAVVVACVATLARALPQLPRTLEQCTSAYSGLDPTFYVREERGYYAGEWDPNTVITFERRPADICQCPNSDPVLVAFKNDDTYTGMKTECRTDTAYARDFRVGSYKRTELSSIEQLDFEMYSDELFPEQTDYPLNVDKVWQVTVPSSYTVHINLSFWFEDLSDGECGDYVALYADADPPEVMCSREVTTTTIVKQGIEKLTIKFHSNEDIANGGFRGTVSMNPPLSY